MTTSPRRRGPPADIATVHQTIIRDVGGQLGDIQSKADKTVDVNSLAVELARNLDQRDLSKLAENLTIRIKEA